MPPEETAAQEEQPQITGEPLPESEEVEETESAEVDEQEEFFATTDFETEDIPDEEELLPTEERAAEAVPEEEQQQESAEPEPEAAPTEEPAPAKPEEPAPEETPKEKAAEPEAAPEESSAPAPDQEAAPQLTDEQIQERVTEWRGNALKALEDHYKFDEETVARIEEDPGELAKELPKMAAQLYLDTVQMAVHNVVQQLPAAIRATVQHTQAADKSEEAFFVKWPQINRQDPKHTQTVQRVAMAYREANKGAQIPEEQFINEVGAQAIISLGLLDSLVQAQQGNGAGQPAAAEVPARQPFQPAGNSPPAAPQGRPTNPFTAVDDELFGQDDLDLG